ncbi:hypothetical protein AAZX31_11G189000 [Glycine max]|uniref:DUF4228 domain-containing protein n=2 Tax=Glycine subgen. Soja TaxID=1462606 RepID=I1LLT3_SOYBN|nr:uncharacterized protein LOC100810027 [Glycine max]XP_028188842.1 uncharacterized protein LOC114375265 [Glycine soja]KAG4974663.1 hypothetical protein JHK87_031484 [Glycine soja]KAG4994823.1 hypothetical protein JHK86_031650 [Glycine max]KAG5124825.1 hypothetical protein JHK82_031562 [Glycine max]KAG5146245.1 hypothetical protein JHK84_031788 [Glycine max]KAH1159714.1 hypothetical protein GYH30_031442 [Glycine max]|eukprot:XP_003538322.1 uncharacterized protein LOC100810027 [Glycine max]
MGNSLRCCLACVLPCGALDLIRIVHLNGYVEEITRPITAGEVLKANPNHVLSKPSSQGVVRRILILSPETELKRGSIYFLIPESSLPEKKRLAGKGRNVGGDNDIKKKPSTLKGNKGSSDDDYSSLSQGCLNKATHKGSKEKKSSCRDRRKGRIGIWRPHLESILED